MGVAKDTLDIDKDSRLGLGSILENDEQDEGNGYAWSNVSIGKSRKLWVYTYGVLEEDGHWDRVDTTDVDGSALNFYDGESGRIELERQPDEGSVLISYRPSNGSDMSYMFAGCDDEVKEVINTYTNLDQI